MDLSYTIFDRDHEVVLPGDLAVLMVGVSARQAASPTAMAQAELARHGLVPSAGPTPFASADGAFNGPVARRIAAWKGR